MDKEFGREDQEIVISMKGSIHAIKNLDMEFLHGRVVIFTKVNIKMTVGMDMDRCIGAMVVFTKDSGRMGFNMEKVKSMFLEKATKKEYLKKMF